METPLYKAGLISKLSMFSYINQMCRALELECICRDSDDYVDLKSLTSKVEYAVRNGFLPLFVVSETGMKVKENISSAQIYILKSYYNAVFARVDKKRKRGQSEIKYETNNIQCVLQKIMHALETLVNPT